MLLSSEWRGVVALLLGALWYESGWLIRLMVLAVMFELSFVGLRSAGRGRVCYEAGCSFLSADGVGLFCQCLLGPFLRGPQHYKDGRCRGGRGCPGSGFGSEDPTLRN